MPDDAPCIYSARLQTEPATAFFHKAHYRVTSARTAGMLKAVAIMMIEISELWVALTTDEREVAPMPM